MCTVEVDCFRIPQLHGLYVLGGLEVRSSAHPSVAFLMAGCEKGGLRLHIVYSPLTYVAACRPNMFSEMAQKSAGNYVVLLFSSRSRV